MATLALATLGTWGDLFPFVGLGLELQRRGHEVRVGASPARSSAVPGQLKFVGLGRQVGFDEFAEHPEILRRIPFGWRAAMRHFVFDQMDELTYDLRAALDGADLLIAHPAHVVAHNVAEHLGVRRVVASVFPGIIPSAYTVPGGTMIGPWRGSLGRAANRQVWRNAAIGVGLLFDRPINTHRRTLGLPPMRAAMLRLPLSAEAVLVMASPHVINPPPDWPEQVEVTSFITWDEGNDGAIQAPTEQFMQDGDDPVLVTLGASSAINPENFFNQVIAAVLQAGGRALVATGPAQLPTSRYPKERVHVVPFVPFSRVALRCRAAVHHGGIGTTASIVRAGIPHVVVPKAFDQPDTAARIEELGVGITVPWRSRRRQLANAVASVLYDERLHAAAANLGERVRGEDGATLTANAIDRLLH